MIEKRLSVITPVYNRADSIEGCLRSVARQEVPRDWTLEHVVVDDGSTDDSYRKVEAFSAAHPHVLHERLPENRGTNAARNRAIRMASGKWIVLLDSDDEMMPGAVAAMCSTIDAEPGFSHFLFATDDTSVKREALGKEAVLKFDDFLLGNVEGDFVHLFLRRRAVDFPFDEDLRIFEGIFFLQFYKAAGSVKFHNDILYHRDRQRADHVSFSLRMTNDKALKAKVEALSLMTRLYADDYLTSERGRMVLGSGLRELYRAAVLQADYEKADSAMAQLKSLGRSAPVLFTAVRAVRAGRMVWPLVRLLVKIKHKLRKTGP